MSSYNNSLIGLGNVLQTTLGAFSTTPEVKADSIVIQEKQMEILKSLSKENKNILKKEFSKIMSKFRPEFKKEFKSIAKSNFDFTRSISAKAKKSIQKEVASLKEKLKNSKRESYFDNSVSTSYSGY